MVRKADDDAFLKHFNNGNGVPTRSPLFLNPAIVPREQEMTEKTPVTFGLRTAGTGSGRRFGA